jgi:tetratricopeptide (TPR) repeat protein
MLARRAEHLFVIESPEAAKSDSVNREIRHWTKTKKAARVYLLHLRGSREWKSAVSSTGDEDSAIPLAIRERFEREPHHISLAFAKDADDLELSRHNPKLADLLLCLNKCVGAMRGGSPHLVGWTHTLVGAARIVIVGLILALSVGLAVFWIAAAREARKREHEALLEKGYFHLGVDEPHEARACFEAARQLDDSGQEAIAGAALAMSETGDGTTAATLLEHWLAQHGSGSAVQLLREFLQRGVAPHGDDPEESGMAGASEVECYIRSVIELERRSRGAYRDLQPFLLARAAVDRAATPRALYYFQMARTVTATGDRDQANLIADTILLRWRDHPQSLFYAALAVMYLDPERSLELLQDKASLPAANVHDRHNLALAYLRVGRVEEARQIIDAVVAEGTPSVWQLRLAADVRVDDVDKRHSAEALESALTWFERAVPQHRDVAGLHARHGHVLRVAGRPGEAEAALRRALELGNQEAECYHDLGAVLLDSKPEEALGFLERAQQAAELEGRPVRAAAFLEAQALVRIAGRHEEGVALLRELFVQAPSVAIAEALGQQLIVDGRLDEADAVLLQVESRASPSSQVVALRGLSALIRGEFERSFDHFSRVPAVSLDPQMLIASFLAALLNGQLERAEEALTGLGADQARVKGNLAAMLGAVRSAREQLAAAGPEEYVDADDPGLNCMVGIAALGTGRPMQAVHSFLRCGGSTLSELQPIALRTLIEVALDPERAVAPEERVGLSRQARGIARAMIRGAAEGARGDRAKDATVRVLRSSAWLRLTKQSFRMALLPEAERVEWERFWAECSTTH